MPNALSSFLNCLVNVVGSLAINLLVTPLVCVPLVPMAYLYDLIRRRPAPPAGPPFLSWTGWLFACRSLQSCLLTVCCAGHCRFVTTSREVKRLDSLAMSPIFGQFSETLQVGLPCHRGS